MLSIMSITTGVIGRSPRAWYRMVELLFYGMSEGNIQACGMVVRLVVGIGGLVMGVESALMIVVARMGVVVCSWLAGGGEWDRERDRERDLDLERERERECNLCGVWGLCQVICGWR